MKEVGKYYKCKLSIGKMIYWEEDSILNKQTVLTPPKEIYQAVCDALGKYFSKQGFKYSRSIPKIVKSEEGFQLELIFRSSGTNSSGESSSLEINGYIRSLELMKIDKSEKGYLNSPTTPLGKVLSNEYPIGTKFVKQIFGETISYVENHRDFNEFTFNRSANVYLITTEKFEMLVKFIEDNILNWLSNLVRQNKMMSCLRESSKPSKLSLERTSFLKFVELKYPGMLAEVKDELKNYR